MTFSSYITMQVMRIEKNRHLTILSVLIKKGDEYCSSDFLAQKAMVSVRTVKSDIPVLNQLLKEDGSARIESLKSKGYRLIPADQKKYDALCETVSVYRILFRSQSIEKANRGLFILQKLLAEEAVKIDDLADSLFVSRSALKEDMSWVTDFIRSFHLELYSVPGKGLMVRGREQDIRSAMLEVICSQYHDIEFMYPVDSFYDWFHTEWYEDIRHEILKLIRESEISITDIGGKKLAVYLCLCGNRTMKGHPLSFAGEEAEELKKLYEYSLAGEIFALPAVSGNVSPDENEILNVARMLRVIRDVNLKSENDRRTTEPEIIERSREMLEDFRKQMKKRNSFRFFQSEEFLQAGDEFASVLVRILNQYAYDYTDQKRMVTYTEMEENHYSPLALEFTRIFAEYIRDSLGCSIAVSDVRAISGIFHYLLSRIPAAYRKQRLAVFSMEGRTVAEMMKQELLRMFGPFIEKADIFNLYEMRRIDFADYDAAVASWNVAYYVYPVPLVVYTGADIGKDRDRLFSDLLMKGYPLQPLQDLKACVRIFQDVRIGNYMDLIRLLGSRFGRDIVHAGMIVSKTVNRFRSASYYNPSSGISMIFLDYEDTGRELFDLYVPENTVFWGNSLEIRCFVVIALRPGKDLSYAGIMHRFLARVSGSREDIRKILSDPQKGLEEIYTEVLKDLFLQACR